MIWQKTQPISQKTQETANSKKTELQILFLKLAVSILSQTFTVELQAK